MTPNLDTENTFRAQLLSTPSKFKKSLTTNKVATYFLNLLCAPISSTLIRVSITGFGFVNSFIFSPTVNYFYSIYIQLHHSLLYLLVDSGHLLLA